MPIALSNNLGRFLDAILLLLVILFFYLGWRAQFVWYGPSYLFLFLVLGLIGLAVISSNTRILNEKVSRKIRLFNRAFLLPASLGAILVVVAAPWQASTILLPWTRDPWDITSSLLLIESEITHMMIDFCLSLFYGTLWALSVPFLANLVVRMYLCIWNKVILSPSDAEQKLVLDKIDPLPGQFENSFVGFFGRSIFFAITTIPVIFTILGARFALVESENFYQAEFSPEFGLAIFFIPSIMGIWYYLDKLGVRVKGFKYKLSVSYLKWIIIVSSFAGLVTLMSVIPDVIKVFSDTTLRDLAAASLIRDLYVPLLSSSMATFVILKSRIGRKWFSMKHSILGSICILFPLPLNLDFIDKLRFTVRSSQIGWWFEILFHLRFSFPTDFNPPTSWRPMLEQIYGVPYPLFLIPYPLTTLNMLWVLPLMIVILHSKHIKLGEVARFVFGIIISSVVILATLDYLTVTNLWRAGSMVFLLVAFFVGLKSKLIERVILIYSRF